MENSSAQNTLKNKGKYPTLHPHRRPSRVLFIPFFLFILGLSILAGKSYYAMKNPAAIEKKKLMAILTPSVSEKTASTPSGASNTTTGETLYQNSADNFSFSYPSSLSLKQTSYGLGVYSLILSNPQDTSVPQIQVLFFPQVLGNYIGQNFSTYYSMQNGTSTVVKPPQGQMAQEVTKVQNTVINGLSAVEITTTNYPVEPNVTPNIGRYIEIGNNELVFLTTPNNEQSLNTIETTLSYPMQ